MDPSAAMHPRAGRSRALPPGWPDRVPPPDAPGWEQAAVAWLFDQCPGDYRAHAVLRRHPVILARFAVGHVESAVEAAVAGLRTVRADLRGLVPAEAIDAAALAYEREGARLRQVLAGATALAAALRGERYVPRL